MIRSILFACVIVPCAGLSACRGESAAPPPRTAAQPAAATVAAAGGAVAGAEQGRIIDVAADSPLRERLQVAPVQSSEIERPIGAPGVIEAVPEQLVRVAPPVAGRVTRLYRTLGDAVQAGEPLFALDSAEVSVARAENAKAQAEVQQAQRDLDRDRLLFENDIISRREYEAAELALATARNDAGAASDLLAQLGAAKGARRDYVLRSPISGRVVEMHGAQGSYWNDINEPILTVADLSTVWVTASVAERDIGQVFVGQRAHIVLNAYPGQPVEGDVRYIDELLDHETRSIKVRVALANPAGRFRPGMFARVAFDGRKDAALTVPATALLQEGMDSRVFVELTPWRYAARTVAVGAQLGDQVEIVSGLRAGERVVVRNGVLLHD